MVFAADIGDTVTATPAAWLALEVEGPFAEPLRATATSDNLVVRACETLIRRDHAIALRLTKRIPIAAGLGGGSTDAAATLRLLNRVLGLGRTREQLAEIGADLGADVPMCVLSTPAIARAIGDELTPVGVPALPLVLACPPLGLRTEDVFRALGRADRMPLPPLPRLADVASVVAWLSATRNDLAAAAASVSPKAVTAAAALAGDATCLLARMTGSGPAAFGIYQSRGLAERAAARLAALQPSWWVVATTTLAA